MDGFPRTMAVEVVAVMVPAAAIPTIHMAERDGSVDWHMPGEDLGPRIEATIPYARWGPEGADPLDGRSVLGVPALHRGPDEPQMEG